MSEAGRERALFSPKVVLGMILAGVFAFSTLVVLSTYAPDLQSGDDGRGHALSKSSVGFQGMVRLLRLQDTSVLVARRNLSGEEPGLIIFTPETGVSRDTYMKALLSSRTLVVLPKWRGGPDRRHAGWVENLDHVSEKDAKALLKAVGVPTATLSVGKGRAEVRLVGAAGGLGEGAAFDTGPITDLQSLSGPGLQPVLSTADGRVVLARRMPTDTYFLADPDLLDNMGLKDIRTAKAGVGVIGLLRKPGQVVAFDVTLNGFSRSRSVLKLAFEPPFVGATLCLAAAAALMGLHAAARFRAVRRGERALALGKAALVDNSAGLIRMARREPAMIGRYAEQQLAAVVRALGGARGGGGGLQGEALIDFLDRQGERFGAAESASSLEREAQGVRTVADLTRVAAKWHQWRLELTRERR
ncbi:MAG: hypothetical protein J7521_07925 [Caulobacter sp.]|nr:hypothetical protein [Caulobacter sp.]